MHLTNLLPSILLLTPALAAPHPAPLDCDSLLSFSGPSEHAIINIRAFCNRRRKLDTSLFKRSVASVFDLPAVRSQQHISCSQHDEQRHLTTSTTITPQASDNDQSLQSYSSHQPHINLSAFSSHTSKIKTIKQRLAHLRNYSLRDFQHNAHGAFLSLSNMSDNLAIACAVAVFFVLTILIAFERWTDARLRWARVRSAETIVFVDAKGPIVTHVLVEKIPSVEKVTAPVEKDDR